jgi:hypothetical protein
MVQRSATVTRRAPQCYGAAFPFGHAKRFERGVRSRCCVLPLLGEKICQQCNTPRLRRLRFCERYICRPECFDAQQFMLTGAAVRFSEAYWSVVGGH